MSSERGNSGKKAQKYQNVTKFRHNPKSKLSEKISKFSSDNVCKKCEEKIEWRKDYRKYKPLTAPKICLSCKKRNIYKAYRTRCVPCATTENVCSKCGIPNESLRDEMDQNAQKCIELKEKLEEKDVLIKLTRNMNSLQLEKHDCKIEDIQNHSKS